MGQWAKIGTKNIYFNSWSAASRNFLPSPSISALSLPRNNGTETGTDRAARVSCYRRLNFLLVTIIRAESTARDRLLLTAILCSPRCQTSNEGNVSTKRVPRRKIAETDYYKATSNFNRNDCIKFSPSERFSSVVDQCETKREKGKKEKTKIQSLRSYGVHIYIYVYKPLRNSAHRSLWSKRLWYPVFRLVAQFFRERVSRATE